MLPSESAIIFCNLQGKNYVMFRRLMSRDLMAMANERHLQPWDETCKRYNLYAY